MFIINFLKHFKCLVDQCKYHCCGGWIISVDEKDIKKYQQYAPEILDNIETEDDEDRLVYKMKRDADRNCSMLDNGICKIHNKYGPEFLPNICSYFPQMYKRVDNTMFILATIGCHGVTKITLNSEDDTLFKFTKSEKIDFIKNDISDFYNYSKMSLHEGLKFYHHLIELTYQSNLKYTNIMSMLYYVARNYDHFNDKFALFDEIDYEYELPKFTNKFLELQTIEYLEFIMSRLKRNIPLELILGRMKNIFGLKLNSSLDNASILDKEKYNKLLADWNAGIYKKYDLLLKNYLRAKISEIMFPILSNNHLENIVLIFVEITIIKLLLMSNNLSTTDDELHRKITIIGRRFYAIKHDTREELMRKILLTI